MKSDVIKFIKSTTFIKIISPLIVVILSVVFIPFSVIFGFFCGYYLVLLIRSVIHSNPYFLGYSGLFFMFLFVAISFFAFFKLIFKFEKNHKPNIFDHIRLCGILYIADIYFVSTYLLTSLEISGKKIDIDNPEAWSLFGSTIAAVLFSSVILANIITIILIRWKR